MNFAEMIIAIEGFDEFVNSERYVAFEIARFNASFTAFGKKQVAGINKYKNPFKGKRKASRDKPLTMGQVVGKMGGISNVNKKTG